MNTESLVETSATLLAEKIDMRPLEYKRIDLIKQSWPSVRNHLRSLSQAPSFAKIAEVDAKKVNKMIDDMEEMILSIEYNYKAGAGV